MEAEVLNAELEWHSFKAGLSAASMRWPSDKCLSAQPEVPADHTLVLIVSFPEAL